VNCSRAQIIIFFQEVAPILDGQDASVDKKKQTWVWLADKVSSVTGLRTVEEVRSKCYKEKSEARMKANKINAARKPTGWGRVDLPPLTVVEQRYLANVPVAPLNGISLDKEYLLPNFGQPAPVPEGQYLLPNLGQASAVPEGQGQQGGNQGQQQAAVWGQGLEGEGDSINYAGTDLVIDDERRRRRQSQNDYNRSEWFDDNNEDNERRRRQSQIESWRGEWL
jgi:hypothetical protein